MHYIYIHINMYSMSIFVIYISIKYVLPNLPCTEETTPIAPPPWEIMLAAMDLERAAGPRKLIFCY